VCHGRFHSQVIPAGCCHMVGYNKLVCHHHPSLSLSLSLCLSLLDYPPPPALRADYNAVTHQTHTHFDLVCPDNDRAWCAVVVCLRGVLLGRASAHCRPPRVVSCAYSGPALCWLAYSCLCSAVRGLMWSLAWALGSCASLAAPPPPSPLPPPPHTHPIMALLFL
jgi:hypothetical protein